MCSPSTISTTHRKAIPLLKRFFNKVKKIFLAVFKWIKDGLNKIGEILTEENIAKAQYIVRQSLQVLSRQFWEPA